jgi:glycerol-3-phosphate dehydrogenase subunit B
LQILNTDRSVEAGIAELAAQEPGHPYALAGADAVQAGLAMLREAIEPAGLSYFGSITENLLLPTALGAAHRAAYAPESFVAGDLRERAPMLIVGPDGWRDFYPLLCAENLARQGFAARGMTFALPESEAGKFDTTPPGFARLFERPEIRKRIVYLLKPHLAGVQRIGFPAILGLEHHREVWQELQEQLGLPIFEIPTLPPSVPGLRLFVALKRALARAGVQLLLDMSATHGLAEGRTVTGVVVPTVTGRQAVYQAERYILATGGLYGGGVTSDHHGTLRETVFDLPVEAPGGLGDWFGQELLGASGHPIHRAGVRVNRVMQPVDADGRVSLENLWAAGRLLAGSQPLLEGSTEGVWLASAYRAAC